MNNKWIASLTASFFLTLSLSATALNQSPAPDSLPPIIPKPAQIQSAPGAFNISPNTPVICAQKIVETAKLAAAASYSTPTGMKIMTPIIKARIFTVIRPPLENKLL